MRLKQLAESSGTSAATIKFYLREGIVPAGRAVNATLAEYDDRHLRRLRLIATLRSLGLGIDRIRALTTAVDGDVPLPDLLGMAQLAALGRDPDLSVGGEARSPLLDEVADELGWSGVPTAARAAVVDQLDAMADQTGPVSPDVLRRYARVADAAARSDASAALGADSRDEAVRIVAVGTASYGQLLVRLVAYAAASRVVGGGTGG